MMPNPLYNAMNNRMPLMGGRVGNFMQMMQQFNAFRNNFNGDPQAEVQRLLNSGKMTQEQYNQLSQAAQMFQNMMGSR